MTIRNVPLQASRDVVLDARLSLHYYVARVRTEGVAHP